MGEGTTTSSFFLQRGNYIEVPSYNFKRVKMILTVPVKKIQEPEYLIRELGTIDIGDMTAHISASEVEVSGDRVLGSHENVEDNIHRFIRNG